MRKLYLYAFCIGCLSFSTIESFGQWVTEGEKTYNTGRVGIGVTNPLTKLDIVSPAQTDVVRIGISSATHALIVRNETTTPAGTPVFSIVHQNGENRDNGFIKFHWGSNWYGGFLSFGANGVECMRIKGGNVGIGTTSPERKLDVVGIIRAHTVQVNTTKTADFVFEEGYGLRTLEEVEQFISVNKHLPEIAPADSMLKDGLDMGEMQIKLLQKIEELTLYIIDQEKRIKELEKKASGNQSLTTTEEVN